MNLPHNFTVDDLAREYPEGAHNSGRWVEVPVVYPQRAFELRGRFHLRPRINSRLFEVVGIFPTQYREVSPYAPQIVRLKQRLLAKYPTYRRSA